MTGDGFSERSWEGGHGKHCGLVVLGRLDDVRGAVAALGAGGIARRDFAILRKPVEGDDMGGIIRLPRIGAVVCDQPLSDLLLSLSADNCRRDEGGDIDAELSNALTGLAAALDELGVPSNRHVGYEEALLHDKILLIAHGPESVVRHFCRIVENIGFNKPVLHLS